MNKILFVCSGNTCRSPLAAGIATAMLARRGRKDIEIASAGTHAANGAPASDEALLVGMERGYDLSGHRARTLTREILDWADLVLVMSSSHLQQVRQLDPAANVHLITAYSAPDDTSAGVHDPFGGDLETYRKTADTLEQQITRVLDRVGEQAS